ncbi:MAG: DUF2079 domain-containing protein [Spirochaetia bacterium]|nr:DUF2079 domain-containing protein [Spirochaetia bacterium]
MSPGSTKTNAWFVFAALTPAALALMYVSPVWLFWERMPQFPTTAERVLEYGSLLASLAYFYAAFKNKGITSPLASGVIVRNVCLILLLGLAISHLTAGAVFHHRTFQSFIYAAHDYTGISHVISSFRSSGRFLDSNYFVAANGTGFYLWHHFAPILVTFMPSAVWSSTLEHYGYTLAVWATSGVVSFYFLALVFAGSDPFRHLNALLLSVCFAVFPVFYNFTISNHFEIAVLPGAFLMFAGVRKQKYLWLAAGLLWTLSIKEDVSVYTALFGLYLVATPTRRREGAAILSASLVWFILLTRIVMPWMSGEHESRFLVSYWGAYGKTPLDIVQYLLLHPGIVLLKLTASLPKYAALFVPFAFLPLLNARYALIVFLPILTMHALATQHFMHDLVTTYYMYTILPYVFYGLLERLYPTIEAAEYGELGEHTKDEGRAGLPSDAIRSLPSSIKNVMARFPAWSELRPGLVLLCLCLVFRAAANEKHEPFLAFPVSRPTAAVAALAARVPAGAPIHAMDLLSVYVPITNEVFPIDHKTRPAAYVLVTEDSKLRQLETDRQVRHVLAKVKQKGILLGRTDDAQLYKMNIPECLTCDLPER